LDAALFALAVAGALTDPLAFSHGIAIVLVPQAFLLERRAAAVRVGLTALQTTAASAAHGAAVPDGRSLCCGFGSRITSVPCSARSCFTSAMSWSRVSDLGSA